MTYEAGFCVFAFIVFCCVLVYALYRRALKVDESVYDDWASAVNETCENINELLSRDDVLELAARFDTDSLESGNSKIPPRPFTNGKPIPKGWQPWEGGADVPVPFSTNIVVMMRNGKLSDGQAGEFFGWEHDDSLWHGDCDILAYRIAD